MTENSLNMIYNASENKKAWVVFTNQADIPYLRMLKDGFRHCFILIYDGKNWQSVDPLAGYMEVAVHDLPDDFDLPLWLKQQGHHVLSAPMTHDIKSSAPLMLLTCVEVCKRVLGIHNRFILTPWQLYKHLNPVKKTRKTHSIFRKGELSWEV